jgi:hypothetical protein
MAWTFPDCLKISCLINAIHHIYLFESPNGNLYVLLKVLSVASLAFAMVTTMSGNVWECLELSFHCLVCPIFSGPVFFCLELSGPFLFYLVRPVRVPDTPDRDRTNSQTHKNE